MSTLEEELKKATKDLEESEQKLKTRLYTVEELNTSLPNLEQLENQIQGYMENLTKIKTSIEEAKQNQHIINLQIIEEFQESIEQTISDVSLILDKLDNLGKTFTEIKNNLNQVIQQMEKDSTAQKQHRDRQLQTLKGIDDYISKYG